METLSGTIDWQILDKSNDQELFLELEVNGQHHARAYIGHDELQTLPEKLNASREILTNDLAEALEASLIKPVTSDVKRVVPDVTEPNLYYGLCLAQVGNSIKGRLIWYDFARSETGPDDAPAVARNLLRLEAHKMRNQQER